ncbi:MAG: hypothetical protein NTY38_10590, partial [Acidobacteria bacterium]|nr:hypothetical protein [Acidobacteriota bacterium]
RKDVLGVSVYAGKSHARGALWGTLIGLGIGGAMAGASLARPDSRNPEAGGPYAFAGAGFIAGIGAAIGGAIGKTRWVELYRAPGK